MLNFMPDVDHYELEIHEGLEDIAQDELLATNATAVETKSIMTGKGFLRLQATDPQPLLTCKTIVAAYRLLYFNVPRPKALLGHEHWTRLLTTVDDIRTLQPDAFHTFFINAAGSDSSIMQRIKDTFADATSLHHAEGEGDLLLRIRRRKPGWDVLIRLTPRPLSTRDWRVCNYEGALSGPVARSMVHLSQPTETDRILNIGSGSGSLMIERAQHTRAAFVAGIDSSQAAITCAKDNLGAAKLIGEQALVHADARQLPFPAQTFTRLYADLPFGQRIGSHEENLQLYPELLREAARIAAPEAQFTLITHEIRLFNAVIEAQSAWQIKHQRRITLRGLHPLIVVLRRLPGAPW